MPSWFRRRRSKKSEAEASLQAQDGSQSSLSSTITKAPTGGPDSFPERLWNQAYDELKIEEPSLVKGYEKILSRELDNGGSPSQEQPRIAVNSSARQLQMQQLVQNGLRRTEREAAVQQGANDALQVIRAANGIITSALQAAPQAALAWTGICLALEVGSTQRPA